MEFFAVTGLRFVFYYIGISIFCIKKTGQGWFQSIVRVLRCSGHCGYYCYYCFFDSCGYYGYWGSNGCFGYTYVIQGLLNVKVEKVKNFEQNFNQNAEG
jgi:hypothetical protein